MRDIKISLERGQEIINMGSGYSENVGHHYARYARATVTLNGVFVDGISTSSFSFGYDSSASTTENKNRKIPVVKVGDKIVVQTARWGHEGNGKYGSEHKTDTERFIVEFDTTTKSDSVEPFVEDVSEEDTRNLSREERIRRRLRLFE